MIYSIIIIVSQIPCVLILFLISGFLTSIYHKNFLRHLQMIYSIIIIIVSQSRTMHFCLFVFPLVFHLFHSIQVCFCFSDHKNKNMYRLSRALY